MENQNNKIIDQIIRCEFIEADDMFYEFALVHSPDGIGYMVGVRAAITEEELMASETRSKINGFTYSPSMTLSNAKEYLEYGILEAQSR